MELTDTICAIATAQGGAIGIVRTSGPRAIEISQSIFSGKLIEKQGYTITFGNIIDEQNNIVDEVLVSVFRNPHSYTGEDATEIACHGSSYILERVVQLLIANGCRMAQPGEFTQRAYLNGKMDLSQAEAVADLIASRGSASHKIAMNQMRGGFSRKLKELRNRLLHLTSLMELELDFSDHEELEFADRTELLDLMNEIESELSKLTNSYRLGNAIKNGIPVAIFGETNVGKSTILNLLLNDDKAIVSDVRGTTRDSIEDTINISGTLFRFIDTAGIRHTGDEVESIGISKTYEKIEKSDILMWVVDAKSEGTSDEEIKSIVNRYDDKDLILVFNKTEGMTDAEKRELSRKYNISRSHEEVFISAKFEENILSLIEVLQAYSKHLNSEEDVIVSSLRQHQDLSAALESIVRAKNSLVDGIPTDLVSQDTRECIAHLSSITGDIVPDAVLSNIFKHFCIGK